MRSQLLSQTTNSLVIFITAVLFISFSRALGRVFFYPQFWNKNGWYGMIGIIRIVCIKKQTALRQSIRSDEELTLETSAF